MPLPAPSVLPAGLPGDVVTASSSPTTVTPSSTCTYMVTLTSDTGSPAVFSDLVQGAHSFRVEASNPAGDVETAPGTRSWTVDTPAPDTNIDFAPANPTNQTTSSFVFSASEPNSTFECSLDGTSPTTCASPASYELGEGAHTFTVWATDTAGNADATPAAHTWTIDGATFDSGFSAPCSSPRNDAGLPTSAARPVGQSSFLEGRAAS